MNQRMKDREQDFLEQEYFLGQSSSRLMGQKQFRRGTGHRWLHFANVGHAHLAHNIRTIFITNLLYILRTYLLGDVDKYFLNSL